MNLLVNSKAPRKLVSYVGGANDIVLDKTCNTCEQDNAKPFFSGEYWRRLAQAFGASPINSWHPGGVKSYTIWRNGGSHIL